MHNAGVSTGAAPSSTFHRPPRQYPEPVPSEPLRLGSPPTVPAPPSGGIIQTLFPIVGGVGLMGFALAFGNSTFLVIALVMMCLLFTFSIGMRYSQKRSTRKRAAAEARRYAAHLRDSEQELAEAGELQRRALARLYPDPTRLWAGMARRRGVWERRPDHPDFLHVRLGRGTIPLDRPVDLDVGVNPLTEYQSHSLHEARRLVERRATLRNEPVVVDLSGVGVLAITGDRGRGRACVRSIVAQLAAYRAPQDLRVITSFDQADREEWEWGKWLPHQRAEVPGRREGPDLPVVTLARSVHELDALLEAELGPRIEQLRRIAESNVSGREAKLTAHTLVVVVDGYRPDHPAADLAQLRELLTRARELGALLVVLTEAQELEPSEIDARLVVPERGTGAYERSGPDAPRIGRLALDEMDVGTSEAVARALTPLRLEQGGDGERGLMSEIRLVEVLGLESASELQPARGAAATPRSRELRAPIGVRADGEILDLDLKQAAEGGMGPHGILVGATGSGKSELLRTLVAGLAAKHDPEALTFVLVDYKGGAAFAGLARLPHVAGLITNLQDDLTLVDRMRDALVGEQERRQRMLREAGDLDDAIAYQAKRATDPSLAPMPSLLLIVDEFAEMLAVRPEFIDLFVSIGRVGRSLGIHLLLLLPAPRRGAPARPREPSALSHVPAHPLRARSPRWCSTPPTPTCCPSLPGLGYLKVDTSVYDQFRTALASAPYREPSAEPSTPPVHVMEFGAEAAATLTRDASGAGAEASAVEIERTDLDVLVDRVVTERGEVPVHQVWLPPLPDALPLDGVEDGPPWWAREDRPGGLRVAAGMIDLPTEQRTESADARLRRLGRAPRRSGRTAHGQEHAPANRRRGADTAPDAGGGAALRGRPRRWLAGGAGLGSARGRRGGKARPRGGGAPGQAARHRGRGAGGEAARPEDRVDRPRPGAARRGRAARGRRPRRRLPAGGRVGGVQARVRRAPPRGRGARRQRPQLRRPRGGGRQQVGGDPAGAAGQPRQPAGAAPARPGRLRRLEGGGLVGARRRARPRHHVDRAPLPGRPAAGGRPRRRRGLRGRARRAGRGGDGELGRARSRADQAAAARGRPGAAAAALRGGDRDRDRGARARAGAARPRAR